MDLEIYVDALLEGASALGVPVSDALARKLAEHQEIVNKWARRINLTTVTDPTAAATRHGLDCLLFSALLLEVPERPTVDIGSGGGFPGLILALAEPNRPLTLLEPIRKRASFLRTAAAQLGAKNVRVVEGRLESGRRADGVSWPAPVIVSRATIPPLDLVPLAAEVLAPGGTVVLTAGAGAPDASELAARASSVGLRHVERREFELPGGLLRVLDRVVHAA